MSLANYLFALFLPPLPSSLIAKLSSRENNGIPNKSDNAPVPFAERARRSTEHYSTRTR